MAGFSGVRLTRDGTIAQVTLDRAERLNTIDLEVAKSMLAAALDLAHDGAIRSVTLAGSGRYFCGGGDLKSFAAHTDGLAQHLRAVTTHLHAALATLMRIDPPIVAAVIGGAAGAGIGLMSVADIIVAADDAEFVFAYNAVGLSPDAGSSWLLPRLVGNRRALDIALTNRTVSAAEALDIGLVTRLVPTADVMAVAAEIATTLATGPTASFETTKRLFNESWSRTYEQQLIAESEALSASAQTADGLEGLAAFMDHRIPKFHGRRTGLTP